MIALTIAGSDSSGGAGIQADLKTFSARGVYGASVITAITAQNTLGVTSIHSIPVDMVIAQLSAVLDDLDVRAIKIGMLGDEALINALADALEPVSVPVVLDPVMVATTGARLVPETAVRALRDRLIHQARLITPNLPEAAVLLDTDVATSEADMLAQAKALAVGDTAVLLKGGHGEGAESVDVLVSGDAETRLTATRHATSNTHGTGCTLSSAIAAELAKGKPLDEAVGIAKDYVTGAIAAADGLNVGRGHGPVHHFHAIW
ncbi:MAG: bifunctional hydroxymethylpyrimidine kinase/phosphomethylpyrimidine kinase [Pseudomonadota bacterium]